MMNERAITDINDRLLALCAVLRWFDRALLAEMAGAAPQQIDALLASDAVAAVGAGRFALRPGGQAALLAQIRAERPLEEMELHGLAFAYFLDRMRRRPPRGADDGEGDEDDCLFHLDRLYPFLTQRLDWPTISAHVAAVREAGARRPQHLHRLALYEGYVAIRTEDYARGERLLASLLDEPGIAGDVRARALLGLAQAQWYQTHYDRALDFYQQLHAFARESGDALYEGLALLNMSSVYNELEQFDRALDLSLESLPIFRALQEPIREAHALYRVGLNALYLGRWPMAQEYLDRAIARFEALHIAEGLALLYWCRGLMYHLLGREADSERAYAHALSLTQTPEYGDSYHAHEVLKGLGLLYQTQGRWEDALRVYDQALEQTIALRGEHWRAIINYRRGNVFERRGRPADAEEAYRAAIDGIEALRAATETEAIKIGLLGTTQQVYEALILLLLGQGRHEEAFHVVERARSRAFLDLLAGRSPQGGADASRELYDAVAQPVATLDEVQAALPEGALLIEYFTIGVLPQGEHLLNKLPPESARLRAHLTSPPQLWVFAVTRDELHVRRSPIDPNKLRPDPRLAVPSSYFLRDRLLVFLYEQLLAPVEDLLAGRDLLYLIPHGPLHYVPFVALRSPAGKPLLDSDGPALAFAPSATVLLRSCLGRARPPRPHTGDACLALGYNDAGDGALAYAEAEARHIARRLGGRAIAGPGPKRAALAAAAPGLGLLHIAGHAFFHADDPLGSELRLGAGETLSARQIIGELRLGADLVTLSACTSGLSRVASGDELMGLQRALLYAGAPTVVCALWETADLVSLVLMDRFYAELERGKGPAVALRDAQAALRAMTGRELQETLDRWRAEDPDDEAGRGALPDVPAEHLDDQIYANPFHWAPFMLIGRP